MSEIHQLLPRVMADIGAIGKDQKNSFQGYQFRGIDDVLNHCHPALCKHNVSVSVQVKEHEITETQSPKGFRRAARVLMDVTFFAPDGSSVVNSAAGEALDTNGDKATNKAMAAAMKYAFFFGLVIPVQPGVVDDSDHDAPTPEQKSEKPKGPTITKAQINQINALATGSKDIDADRVARGAKYYSQNRTGAVEELTKAEAADLILKLEKLADKIPA